MTSIQSTGGQQCWELWSSLGSPGGVTVTGWLMSSLQAALSATDAHGNFSLISQGASSDRAGWSCGPGLEPLPRADAWFGDKHRDRAS